MSEERNPWDGIGYSIRAYDHNRGEYRDFDLDEVPAEVFHRWLMWKLGQMEARLGALEAKKI